LVCSVASTRCPVNDACTAICAVSRSRISPIMITSGVLAQDRAQRAREVELDARVDLRLRHPVERVLDGSSTVIMLTAPRGSRDSAA
jgi:hypothetical protein